MNKKRHSQFRIFSQPCFNSPAKGWPYKFFSRGTIGSSILDHNFGHLCRGRRIQLSGHSDLGIFINFGASSIFTLGASRCCVCCLSIATRQFGDDIHDFSCCHLRCWRSLLSENCIRTWVVFYNITAKHNSTIVFLVLCFQFVILQVTHVHQWCKMNCSARRPCFIDHLLFRFWVVKFHAEIFSNFSHSLSTAAFPAGIFRAWGIGINLWTKL